MANDKLIIPYHELDKDEYDLCKYYITSAGVTGNFIGAVRNPTQISPVLLNNKLLKVLRCTKTFSEKEQSSLEQIEKYYSFLVKENPDYQYGIVENFFWLLRDFRLNTLSDYLTTTTIKEAEANYLTLKILDLIKKNHTSNIPHGHLTPNNFIIDQEELSLVDHLISYVSFKDINLEFMSPEAKRGHLPTMASDLYAFGKIIKFIYQGISCPLPMDLPDRLCHSDPKKRPLIFEVEGLVNGIFKGKRHQTEHWHTVESFGDVDNPNFEGYLTPELIQKIRKEYSQESKRPSEGLSATIEDSKPDNHKEVESEKSPKKELNKQDFTTNIKKSKKSIFNKLIQIKTSNSRWQMLAVLVLLALAYLLFFNSKPAEQAPSKYQQIISLLERSQIQLSEETRKVLSSLNKGNYKRGDILTFISPDDSEVQQKLKLNALLSLLSDQPDLLVKIYTDSENFGLFKNDFLWLKNPIINWSKINPLTKLLIFTNRVPNAGLSTKHLFDLLYHPSENIQNQAKKRLIHSVAKDKQAEFYLELLKNIQNFTREELAFLLEALEKDGGLQLALITTWFDNTKPNNSIIFDLVLTRKPPAQVKGKKIDDYFSFAAARYLKDYLEKLPKDQLKKLKNHHEGQLRIYGEM